ncbi:MAG: hypothetical protein A2Z88_05765 [Omnitrophica WOR_2 bacterium GWA2_47_8]|nr:MAG: hypothetical protein A2Z88_05765 [Omnitrophica WOR_2 bacterium GWA2_47_8]
MSLTFHAQHDIGYIEFDHPDSKVNVLTSDVMKRFGALLDEAATKTSLKALVIQSKKKNVFIAGADIKEIEGITDAKEGAAKAEAGQLILDKLEDFTIPTIAVIDGVALGGGCELALACRYRVGTFNEKILIGLPEVNLGIMPGFGGTYRMPRLLGLSEGLKMIVSGRPINGEKALKAGLLDRLYPQTNLDKHVARFVEEILGGVHISRKKKKGVEGLLDSSKIGQEIIFSQTESSIVKSTKGFYPAPLRAMQVIKRTFYLDRQRGMKLEAEAFGKLAVTDVSKSLVKVFYATEKYKKLTPPGTENITPMPIAKCAVLGAGVMGGGIAQALSAKDIWVRLKDVNNDALAKGYQAAYKIYKDALKRKRLKPHEVSRKMAHITSTLDYTGFETSDMVIEAIIEKMEIKKKVFKELSGVVNPKTILCSNTSALSVTEMAKETKDPSKVIGLHFFNPVNRMPLIEVVVTPLTSPETLAATINFVKILGKTPIVAKDKPGFLVNRILLSYINEAGRILEEGADMQAIDRVMVDFGMPMGPFNLTDEVGIDVGYKVLEILHHGLGERFKPVEIFHKVFEKGLLGKKAGKGFYIHKEKRVPNPDVQKLISARSAEGGPTDWSNRMLVMMINEAARCLEEGIVDEAMAVDVGMILGTGFPPFRGGLLRYADAIGIGQVIELLKLYESRSGAERFKPCAYLLKLQADGRKFYADYVKA